MRGRLTPKASLSLAITSVFLTPVVLWVELIVLLLADMVTYEPSNPLFVKALAVGVVVLAGAVALALPLFTLLRSDRVAAQVISGVVLALWAIVQVYFVLMVAGICALDGCSAP